MKRSQEHMKDLQPSTNEEVKVIKTFPSTPSQMEIWLQCYLGGKEAAMAYNESSSFKLFGNLHVSYLREAFSIVISRHEGMRALFTKDGKRILIFETNNLPIRFKDISDQSESQKIEFLKKHSRDTGLYEFDFVKGPLYVLELIRINDEEHMVTFTGHHLIFDGWSMKLLAEELSSAYGQLSEGEEVNLPKAHNLSDYVLRNLHFSNSIEMVKIRDFWKDHLSNPIPQFDLPIDFERPAIRNLSAARIQYKAPRGLIVKAKRYASSKNVSANVLLLSIFELFLSQWVKNSEVILGMPRAGQPLLGSSKMIGHSVHLLPISAKIDLDLTFEEYLCQRREAFVEVLANGRISFGELIQSLKIKRDPSRIPLLPLTFNMEIGIDKNVKFNGMNYEFISNPKSFSNFEIVLNIFGSLLNTTFEWTYSEKLFKEETIYEAAHRYRILIEKIIENPKEKLVFIKDLFEEMNISEVLEKVNLVNDEIQESNLYKEDIFKGNNSLIPEIQLSQNKVESDKNPLMSVPLAILKLEKSADLYPKKHAIITGDNFLTYEELNRQSNQLSNLLKGKGVKPGDVVGIYMERSNAIVISILATLKAGAAYMPIDVEVPDERVVYMFNNSNSKYYITDQPAFENNELYKSRLIYSEMFSEFDNYSISNSSTKIHLDNPMYIIYTSGSTGNPKAVSLSRKNIDYFIKEVIEHLNFCSEDVIAAVTSVSFDAALLETFIPFSFGATVYMMDKYQRKDPNEILRLFEDKKITKTIATPTHWQLIVNSGWKNKIPSLTVLTIGEPLKKALVDHIALLSKEIINLYGPAETTVYSTYKKIDSTTNQISIGNAVPGTKIYLVDRLGQSISKVGVSGEIWIGGDGVGLGYLGLKELTNEKFINNSFDAYPKNLYKTGDLGVWLENGEIQCEGRIDHQIKIRGHRVELGEVEQRILSFEEVANAVVDTDKSTDIDTLVGFISIRENLRDILDYNLYTEKLRQKLSVGLPDYMVPTEFRFVDDFKLTTSGKIDRKQLPDRKVKLILSPNYSSKATKSTLGLSKIEVSVHSIWSEILGINQIDLDDDFFLVGGHSLLGVKLISILEKEFNVSLSLLALFQHPSIRALSTLIEKKKYDSSSDSLVLIKNGSPDKVLCFVHGVGLNPIEVKTLIKYMSVDQKIYGLQSPAISGNARPIQTIPEMAGHYINELDNTSINEPYNLIGNSIGGIIVYEMARQLKADNKSVGFVGMIDTIALCYDETPMNLESRLSKSLNKLKFEFQFLLDDPSFYMHHRARYLQEKWSNIKRQQRVNTDLASRIKEIEQVNRNAWESYIIEPTPVDITLFLAERKTFYVDDFETLGWSKYARSIDRFTMPGDHSNMLKPPNGKEFTKVLQIKLDQLTVK